MFIDSRGNGHFPWPMAMTTPATFLTDLSGSGGLKEAYRIRNEFPETWLWSSSSVGYVSLYILITILSTYS